MFEKIKEIICTYMGDDNLVLTEDTNLTCDLGMTSYDIITIACEIEDEYKIELTSNLQSITTVKNIMECIKER
jgi:acyl carrier protein